MDRKPAVVDSQHLHEPRPDQEGQDEAVSPKRKRKRDDQRDEIDVLFEGVKENRYSKAGSAAAKEEPKGERKDLEQVLSAIKAAPKGESAKRRKG